MAITPDNFFRIEGWMRTELNLKGNELMAYALIYSFQTAYDKPFDGSQAYIAEWLGTSRQHTNVILAKLETDGMLEIQKTCKGYIRKNYYKCLNARVRKSDNAKSENPTTQSQKIRQRSVRKSDNIETDIETDTLNRYMKERGDATEFAPSLAPSNSVENSDSNSETKKPKTKRFVKPTIEQIEDYCKEKNLELDAEYFWNYYESVGWMCGRSHMKNWQLAVQNWVKREKEFNKPKWKGTNYGSNSYGNNGTTSTQDDYVSEYDYEPDEIIYT